MRFAILVLLPVALAAQPVEIKVPFVAARGAQKEFRKGTLVFDEAARRAAVTAKGAPPIEFGYDAVTKVLVEPDVRISYSFGAAFAGFALGGGLFGGQIADAIKSAAKMDVTVYLEYAAAGATAPPVVFSVGKEQTAAALGRLDAAFGSRVALAGFAGIPVEAPVLDLGPRHLVKANPAEHPIPELRAAKALVVVACPTGTGLDAARTDKYQKWGGYILAGNKILALNAPGTYSFFYLDPGDYVLVSHVRTPGSAQSATGLELHLEAGKEYDLIQTIYIAGIFRSFLRWHSRDLVMHEVANLYWADWQPPKP